MNEACDIHESGGRCVCRHCGSSWHGTAEAGPCGTAPRSLAARAWEALRPRSVGGLALWVLLAGAVIPFAVATFLVEADRLVMRALQALGVAAW